MNSIPITNNNHFCKSKTSKIFSTTILYKIIFTLFVIFFSIDTFAFTNIDTNQVKLYLVNSGRPWIKINDNTNKFWEGNVTLKFDSHNDLFSVNIITDDTIKTAYVNFEIPNEYELVVKFDDKEFYFYQSDEKPKKFIFILKIENRKFRTITFEEKGR